MSNKLSMLRKKSISTSSGPNYSGTVTNHDAGSDPGNLFWYNLNNLSAEDSFYTEVYIYDCCENGAVETDALQMKNFGFAIPSTSIIDGIEIKLQAGFYPILEPVDSDLYLIPWLRLGDYGSSTSYGGGDGIIMLSSYPTLYTSGGPTNKWTLGYTQADWDGQVMTASIINDPTFGLTIQAASTFLTGGYTVTIDYITMKVYYTA